MKHPIYSDIEHFANPHKALQAQRFFKTGNGEYGAGDIFVGLTVPECRSIAKKYAGISYDEITALLESKIHEHRLIALHILTARYTKQVDERSKIVKLYLSMIDRVNNWDLVDTSAAPILGADALHHGDTKTLEKLIRSKTHFHRRVAVVATFSFIRSGDDTLTYRFAELCMNDTEDLMHKAVGWMLRECGKRVSRDNLRLFLDRWAAMMPRTMLRYALEHFDREEKDYYMSQKRLKSNM